MSTMNLMSLFFSDSDDSSFRWTSPATKLLLTMYLKQKRDFHNPGVKKRPLWREIKQAFKSQGFEAISESTLDRKIRNIKRRYKTILLQNNRNKSSHRSSVKWEFFDLCEKIFGKHLLFPEHLPLTSKSKRNQAPLESGAEDEETLDNYWTEELENFDSPEDNPLTNATQEYLIDETKPFHLNQQWMKVQREKTDALNKIAQCMQENNKIQKERNDILRKLLVNRNALNLGNVEVGEILEGEIH